MIDRTAARIAGIERTLARRSFLAAAFALLVFAPVARADTLRAVTERDVIVTTPNGSAEAALFYPASAGRWPAILFWPDFVGLRPVFRDMARRFAAQGFVVLVPNTFYRSMRPSDAELDPKNPAVRAMLMQYRSAATAAGIASDAASYIAFLDAQPQTAPNHKVATIGYDLGASYAFRAAATSPDRIGAVGSIYGLGVATTHADSPHLLVPRSRATYYVAMARNDDVREPEDKTDIAAVIKAAGLPGKVEVYPADHGWANPAGPTYDAAAARRAFAALVALCRATIGAPVSSPVKAEAASASRQQGD